METITGKTPAQLTRMREAGRIVAEVLDLLKQEARAGVSTGELDRLAEDAIRQRGAVPAFKGYRGFPASICTCVNAEVVHGIPGERVLCDGDVFSVDVGVFYRGYAGDAAVTVGIGDCAENGRRIIRTTEEALEAALDTLRPGVRVSEISRAVETVAGQAGYGLVRQYTGHGIGECMHEAPQVPNVTVKGRWMRSPRLPEGATVAIEPMLTEGSGDVRVLSDGWTVVTVDGQLAAHAEHTVAIGRDGPVILTAR